MATLPPGRQVLSQEDPVSSPGRPRPVHLPQAWRAQVGAWGQVPGASSRGVVIPGSSAVRPWTGQQAERQSHPGQTPVGSVGRMWGTTVAVLP